MARQQIEELKRIFITRLDTLDHILSIGEKHFPDMNPVLKQRLAPDMFPLGTQIAFACNQPRGFAQWCAGEPIENLDRDVETLELARTHIQTSKELVSGISVADSKLDEIKHLGLGPGFYCDLPGRQYVDDFLLPNFYFHITTTYAILRSLGAPLGKPDFMAFLGPYVKQES